MAVAYPQLSKTNKPDPKLILSFFTCFIDIAKEMKENYLFLKSKMRGKCVPKGMAVQDMTNCHGNITAHELNVVKNCQDCNKCLFFL